MRRLLFSLTIMATALGGTAVAQQNPNAAAEGAAVEEVVGIVFSALEEHMIREYYAPQTAAGGGLALRTRPGGPGRSLPPGLAKREELPPGLERQYQRNGALPPGLARRALPEDLTQRLPRPRYGTERVVVDNDVILIEQATGLILDILTDVLQGG